MARPVNFVSPLEMFCGNGSVFRSLVAESVTATWAIAFFSEKKNRDRFIRMLLVTSWSGDRRTWSIKLQIKIIMVAGIKFCSQVESLAVRNCEWALAIPAVLFDIFTRWVHVEVILHDLLILKNINLTGVSIGLWWHTVLLRLNRTDFAFKVGSVSHEIIDNNLHIRCLSF